MSRGIDSFPWREILFVLTLATLVAVSGACFSMKAQLTTMAKDVECLHNHVAVMEGQLTERLAKQEPEAVP